jgi:hypothetical protein
VSSNGCLKLTVAEKPVGLARIGLEVQFAATARLREERDRRFAAQIAACVRLEGEALRRALELAFDRHQRLISDGEVIDWLQTLDGTVFTLWQALRPLEPRITEAEAREIYFQLSAAQLEAVARFLAGNFADPDALIPLTGDARDAARQEPAA